MKYNANSCGEMGWSLDTADSSQGEEGRGGGGRTARMMGKHGVPIVFNGHNSRISRR